MEIYADIVFTVNLVMDSFVLWTVSKLSGRAISITRALSGGAVMSLIYCVLIFVAQLRPYLNIFASIIIIMLGIIIAFRPKDVKCFLKLAALSHIAAITLGGLGTAIFYYTNIPDIIGNVGGAALENFSLGLLIGSMICFYVIFKIVSLIHKARKKKGMFYITKVYFEDNDIDIRMLADTGNLLHDPLSDSPVIIAEFGAVKDFLPDGVKLIFYEHKELDLAELAMRVKDTSFSGRIRMIPFASLGKQNGMLIGFRPDRIEIIRDEQVMTRDDVIIGIYNFKLSHTGEYQGLLNRELLI